MKRDYFRLNADGGIVGEPGQPAGEASIGVVLKNPDGSSLHEISVRIGWQRDHHVAEYRALIAGLRLARGHGIDHLRVFLDSAVVVNHVNLKSRTKQDYIDHLTEALALKREFADIEILHVPRKQNKEAHELADRLLRSLRSKR
ncbi:MAG: ribonuclease HI family protein [Acidimicrobiia bacterium]